MKPLFIALFMAAPLLVAQEELKSYSTTATLPDNRMIWPLPDFSEFKDGVQITGKFIEAKPILTVRQGNWEHHTLLVRYKIIKPDKKYRYNEISFIFIYRWPTRASGIKMKALPFHFRDGLMSFFLKQDKEVKYMDFFNIISYKKVSESVNL